MSLDKFHQQAYDYAEKVCDELEEDMLYARGVCRALDMPLDTGTKELRNDAAKVRKKVLDEILDIWDEGKSPVAECDVIPMIENAIVALDREKRNGK